MTDTPGCRCPTCGQLVPESDTPTVDLLRNAISFRGRIMRLPPREAEIAKVLSDVATISDRDLMIRVWGRRTAPVSSIHVHISRLRKKLGSIGLTIRSTRRPSTFRLEAINAD